MTDADAGVLERLEEFQRLIDDERRALCNATHDDTAKEPDSPEQQVLRDAKRAVWRAGISLHPGDIAAELNRLAREVAGMRKVLELARDNYKRQLLNENNDLGDDDHEVINAIDAALKRTETP